MERRLHFAPGEMGDFHQCVKFGGKKGEIKLAAQREGLNIRQGIHMSRC